MNAMIRPMLPCIPYNQIHAEVDRLTLVSSALLLIGAVCTAVCIGLYAAEHFGGNKKKTVLVFAGITGLVTLAMLCLFGWCRSYDSGYHFHLDPHILLL